MIRTLTTIALAATLLAGCGGGSDDESADETFTAYGRLTLAGQGAGTDGGACEGRGGYDDVNASTQVTVTDPSSKKIAVADLGAGTSTGGNGQNCTFSIKVPDVPAGEKLYTFAVGTRGEQTHARADVESELSSQLDLTLGS